MSKTQKHIVRARGAGVFYATVVARRVFSRRAIDRFLSELAGEGVK